MLDVRSLHRFFFASWRVFVCVVFRLNYATCRRRHLSTAYAYILSTDLRNTHNTLYPVYISTQFIYIDTSRMQRSVRVCVRYKQNAINFECLKRISTNHHNIPYDDYKLLKSFLCCMMLLKHDFAQITR